MRPMRLFLPLLVLGGLSLAGCDIEPVNPSEVVTLNGVVLDDATGQPISGATVSTVPATSQATTGPDGRYSIAGVHGGYYTLTASAQGYRQGTHEIAARSTATPDTLRLVESFPNAGLLLYLPLDGSAIDASGRGRNGLALATGTTADRFGELDGAMLFDGRSSTVTVADGPDLNFSAGSDYSVVAWVRFSSLQSQRPGVVSKGSGATRGYELRITGGKAEAAIATSIGAAAARTDRLINDNRWHMIGLATEKSRGLLHFCLDGDLVDVVASPFLSGDVGTASSLVIGRSAATGAYFEGAIDDVRVFGRGLAKEDFRLLYHERGY